MFKLQIPKIWLYLNIPQSGKACTEGHTPTPCGHAPTSSPPKAQSTAPHIESPATEQVQQVITLELKHSKFKIQNGKELKWLFLPKSYHNRWIPKFSRCYCSLVYLLKPDYFDIGPHIPIFTWYKRVILMILKKVLSSFMASYPSV